MKHKSILKDGVRARILHNRYFEPRSRDKIFRVSSLPQDINEKISKAVNDTKLDSAKADGVVTKVSDNLVNNEAPTLDTNPKVDAPEVTDKEENKLGDPTVTQSNKIEPNNLGTTPTTTDQKVSIVKKPIKIGLLPTTLDLGKDYFPKFNKVVPLRNKGKWELTKGKFITFNINYLLKYFDSEFKNLTYLTPVHHTQKYETVDLQIVGNSQQEYISELNMEQMDRSDIATTTGKYVDMDSKEAYKIPKQSYILKGMLTPFLDKANVSARDTLENTFNVDLTYVMLTLSKFWSHFILKENVAKIELNGKVTEDDSVIEILPIENKNIGGVNEINAVLQKSDCVKIIGPSKRTNLMAVYFMTRAVGVNTSVTIKNALTGIDEVFYTKLSERTTNVVPRKITILTDNPDEVSDIWSSFNDATLSDFENLVEVTKSFSELMELGSFLRCLVDTIKSNFIKLYRSETKQFSMPAFCIPDNFGICVFKTNEDDKDKVKYNPNWYGYLNSSFFSNTILETVSLHSLIWFNFVTKIQNNIKENMTLGPKSLVRPYKSIQKQIKSILSMDFNLSEFMKVNNFEFTPMVKTILFEHLANFTEDHFQVQFNKVTKQFFLFSDVPVTIYPAVCCKDSYISGSISELLAGQVLVEVKRVNDYYESGNRLINEYLNNLFPNTGSPKINTNVWALCLDFNKEEGSTRMDYYSTNINYNLQFFVVMNFLSIDIIETATSTSLDKVDFKIEVKTETSAKTGITKREMSTLDSSMLTDGRYKKAFISTKPVTNKKEDEKTDKWLAEYIRQMEIERQENERIEKLKSLNFKGAEHEVETVQQQEAIETVETDSKALMRIGPWDLDNNDTIYADQKTYAKVEDKILTSKEGMFITSKEQTRWKKFKSEPLQKLFEHFQNQESRHVEIEISHKLIILMNLLGHVMLTAGPVSKYEYLQNEAKELGYDGNFEGLDVVDIYALLVGGKSSSLKCLVDINALLTSYKERIKEKEVRDLFIWWNAKEISQGLRTNTRDYNEDRLIIALSCMFDLSSKKLPAIRSIDRLIENMNLFKAKYG